MDMIDTLDGFVTDIINTLDGFVTNVNGLIVITEVINTLDNSITKTSNLIKVTNKIDTPDGFVTNKATYLVNITYNRFIINAKSKDLIVTIDTHNSSITDKDKP